MAARKPRYWKSLQLCNGKIVSARDKSHPRRVVCGHVSSNCNGKIVSARDKSPWTVGEWREVPAPVRECEGLNCCRNIIDAMSYVDMEVLAEVEIDGKRVDSGDKITVQRMRIIRAWRWTRQDSVLLIAYMVKLYLAYLEKSSRLDAVHSKEEIESAKRLIKNPTYENTVAALAALFGGYWSYGEYAGAFCWLLDNPVSVVGRSLGARLAFPDKILADFMRKSHGWIVKHTVDMGAF